MSTSVVLQLQGSNHVVGVLKIRNGTVSEFASVTYVGSVLHGGSSSGNLGGVSLNKSGENGVGKSKLGQVLGNILLHFVSLETGGGLQGLSRDDGGGSGFVRDGREVFVGNDSDLESSVASWPFPTLHGAMTDLVKLGIELHDLVGDGASLGESGHILSNTAESDVQGLGHGSGKLSLWLFTDNRQCTGSGGLGLFDVSRDGRVDTTAKTSVGCDCEIEDLGVFGLFCGLGLGKEFCELSFGRIHQ